MSHVVYCYEAHARPQRVSLQLSGKQTRFFIYLLEEPDREAYNLRATALRSADAAPPANGRLLLELEIVEIGRSKEPSRMGFQARRLEEEIDLLVSNRIVRLAVGNPLESGSRFSVRRGALTLEFGLEVQGLEARGAVVGVGGREEEDDALQADLGAMVWAVPTVATALSSPMAKVAAAFKSLAKRLRLTPALLTPILMTMTLGLGLGFATWSQYRRAEAAETRAEQLAQSTQANQVALEQAARGEAECMAQRVELSLELGKLNEARAVRVQDALSRSSTRALAIRLGGQRLDGDAVNRVDEVHWQSAVKRVVERMGELRLDAGALDPCLAMSELLGQDLPAFVLAWHPIPDRVCPEDYAQILEGVDRAGRFGLSTRAALLSGEDYAAALSGGEDARQKDHWSAAAHLAGLRGVARAMLAAPIGQRPPAAPSTATLWALALWDAYNRFPDRPEGEAQTDAETCVAEAMLALEQSAPEDAPGTPLLPDIAAFAADKRLLSLQSSAMCPWTPEGLQLGASNALTAAARLALTSAEGGT